MTWTARRLAALVLACVGLAASRSRADVVEAPLVGPPAPSPTGPPSPESMAASVLHWLDVAEKGQDAEALETARVGLRLGGLEIVPALLGRLDRDLVAGKGAVSAWALGVAAQCPCGSSTPRPQGVESALERALESPDRDVKLAAASALGAMEAQDAAPVLAALYDQSRLDGDEAAASTALTALAGVGGDLADARLALALRDPGDVEWATDLLAATLRRGQDAWPLLVAVLRDAPDARCRAVAASALLLLAEPDATCGVIEVYGGESEPPIRRTLLQALSASGHPLGRDFLRHVARVEGDESLREVADNLASAPAWHASEPGEVITPTRARQLILSLAETPGLPRHVDDVEEGAERSQIPLLSCVLRRLPLRGDARWLEDHARLAQLRGRLRCADGLDCDASSR